MPPIGTVTLSILVFLCSFSTALALNGLDEAWKEWKETHAKGYHDGEEALRRTIWEKNLQQIQDYNLGASLGKHRYWLAMNHLGDLTDEEFNQLNGYHPELVKEDDKNTILFQESATLRTPKQVDWRTKGYVTPVKTQGSCGSCWAFSATGALEALLFNHTGRLISLSEQNLIDCTWKLGNKGCAGGIVSRAFQYVWENKGINSECTYPYMEEADTCCHYKPWDPAANCTSLVRIPYRNEVALEQAVATVGPVSVGVDAKSFAFRFYKSGIFYSVLCRQRVVHAMLVVGYGTSEEDGVEMDYWILKNSWSERWGEHGYMRLVKGVGNHCGIANQAVYPIL